MANPRPIKPLPEEHPFHQKDALKSGIRGALTGGGFGLLAAAFQNTIQKQNVGAMGVFTKHGRTIGIFTSVVSVYAFSKDATANLREKDSTLNVTVAAFLAGSTLGLFSRSIPRVLGAGAAFSILTSAFDYTGGHLRGKRTEHPEMDEYEHKEFLRKNRRRPLSETIADVGEARGIKPPGYEERRRERLREKYGVEINPVSATVD
ncbi:hypothetical protein F4780DRAFT_782643 [Xylariomycetidae sp. FL0641]|nr:hypothetical protein F4780DRAFT_782643 [Xylariomycetidae sp. FL0641]